MSDGHAAERVAGTGARDGAFVAADAAVVADLQEEGAVAETVAAFDALGAADAQLFVNRVFVIRVFDEGALDGTGRTELIFRRGGQCVGFGLEIPRAKIAIAAQRVT